MAMGDLLKCAFGSKLVFWMLTAVAVTAAWCEQFGLQSVEPNATDSPMHAAATVAALFVMVSMSLLLLYLMIGYRKLYHLAGAALWAVGSFGLFDLLYLNGGFLSGIHVYWFVAAFVAGTFVLVDHATFSSIG